MPVAKGYGRPRIYVLRGVINGIRYVQRYGIPWDAIPKDLAPGSICYDYWRLTDGGHMEQINHRLVMADRGKAGREASPTLAIVDAQAVKCDAPLGERDHNAAKKIFRRKRHVVVDTDGRLLAVTVTTANVQDQDGGIALVRRLVRLCPWIKTVVVDGAATRDALSKRSKRQEIGWSRLSNGRSSPRASCCYDNAPMQSFSHTLKVELARQRRWATHDEARRDLFACIEVYYNRQHIHSAIGYLTPEQAERKAS